MGGGDSPQYRQECIDAKTLGKRPEPWLAAGKTLGHQPLERIQRGMDGLNAPAHPAQHTRQLDLQAQIRTRRLQAPGLLDVTDQRLHFGQGARQARSQTVRQQTEGAMALRAIPAGDNGSGRGETLIAAVARKPAATLPGDVTDSRSDLHCARLVG